MLGPDQRSDSCETNGVATASFCGNLKIPESQFGVNERAEVGVIQHNNCIIN